MKKGIAIALIVILAVAAVAFGVLYVQQKQVAAVTAEQIDSLTADVAAKDETIATLTTDAETKDETIATLTADVAAKDEAITTLTADVAAKDEAITTLTADVTAKDETITTLTADVAAKDETIANLTADVTAKDEKIAELEKNQGTAAPDVDLSGITDVQYVTTKTMIYTLGEHNFSAYEIKSTSNENTERMELTVNKTSKGGTKITYVMQAYFRESGDRVNFYVWDLITFNPANRDAVIALCNKLNADWQWLTFYVEKDGTGVCVKYTLPIVESSTIATNADLMWSALLNIDSVIGLGYDELAPYAK